MPLRYSYSAKFGAAIMLALFANWLFLFHHVGATTGYFALAVIVALVALRPAIRSNPAAIVAIAIATGLAGMLIEAPSLLAAILCWTALAFAAISPRVTGPDDVRRWAVRLLLHLFSIPVGPVIDAGRWARARRRVGADGRLRLLPLVALPIAGSLVFLALFATANPIIADALARFDTGLAIDGTFPVRIAFVAMVFALGWALLRPFVFVPLGPPHMGGTPMSLPGVSAASVTLSLVTFNALFAVQNGLDIAFLWSGAPLPGKTTMADYAHQGAYPLIATALLAGLFVLVTMRPGSETAARPAIRALVTIWVAQNILLVASSMLRTFDYIDAYSLTRLRIAALVWMGLVALGLMLICLRMWRGKSDRWLIGMNAAAALLVLGACSVVDLGRMAAAWNVRHAREAGGRGVHLDLCYLNELGSSALLPIVELEGRTRDAALREKLTWSRNRLMDEMEPVLTDWRGWTWRDDRRFRTAERLIAEKGLKRQHVGPRQCNGVPFPSPEPAVASFAETAPAEVAVPAPPTIARENRAEPLTAEPKR
ncbi:DUF4153 domain-containing protein [Sphingomonas colocasiae]|uniref:DUF4173 domain-containing protein n=1 Tax=Sphingomonas colocasiae TaxID=1848973 RepID=A0ABS7PIT7_9SPHN|nr:DUF4173 domain-containing protein [Sphingomonas colocasiae]MBY8821214.1 DUF4173 domain-containing protein [Sphingomonas colocasiae]